MPPSTPPIGLYWAAVGASTTRRTLLAVTALFSWVLAARPAGAQSGQERLAEARRRMDAVELERAIDVLEAADRSPEVSAAERLEALLLLVECNLAFEDTQAAAAAARRIRALDPGFEPPA